MPSDRKKGDVRLVDIPGHMRRAAREIMDACARMDFIIVVVDARAPLTTDNPRFRSLLPALPVLLVAVKADLAPDSFRSADYLYVSTKKRSDISLVHNALKQVLRERVESRREAGMQLVKSYGIVIGLPNVGKSSLINFLARSKKADAQDRPGVTRRQQWIKVTPELELWDTPGVLPNRVDQERAVHVAVLLNLVPYDEVMAGRAFAWLADQPRTGFLKAACLAYDLSGVDGLEGLLEQLALKRNYLLKGGRTDRARALLLLFKDFNAGVLGRFCLDSDLLGAQQRLEQD